MTWFCLINDLPVEKILFIFKTVPASLSAEVFTYLENETKEKLTTLFSDKEIKNVMEELYSDDLAAFTSQMPANIVRRILRSIDPELRGEINHLLNYEENSAGSLMTLEYIELRASDTCKSALRKIKKQGKEAESIATSYIVDNKRTLIGYIELKDILFSDEDELIGNLMDKDIISVKANDRREDVANLVKKYDINMVPVTNEENKLIGIITVDDIIDVLEKKNSEDIEKMSAINPLEDEYFNIPAFEMARKLVFWLIILMILSLVSGYIIDANRSVVIAFSVLTVFIPMLIDSAGNAGGQTTALVIRGLSLGTIKVKDYYKVLVKETMTAIIVGLILAIVNYGWLLLQQNLGIINVDDSRIFVLVSLTLMISIVVAKSIGSSLPILAKVLKLDPALMSGSFVTTVADVLALIVYFYLAGIILN